MKFETKQSNINFKEIGVILIGYNRPEFISRRLDELSNSPLEYIYVSIDGGDKVSQSTMANLEKKAISIYGKRLIKWNQCQSNLGMTRHITQAVTQVLSKHPFAVIIEDDVVVTKNFLENIASGLKIQKELGFKGIVSGNSQFYSQCHRNKWRTTVLPSIWGWACSRQTWHGYSFEIKDLDIEKELEKSDIWRNLGGTTRGILLKKIKRSQSNPYHVWDTQLIYHLLKNNFVSLAPIFSISGNEGFGDTRAAHTQYHSPKNIKNNKLNNYLAIEISNYSKIYEFMDWFSLKHRIKYYYRLKKTMFKKLIRI